jgi:hypothetical protein
MYTYVLCVSVEAQDPMDRKRLLRLGTAIIQGRPRSRELCGAGRRLAGNTDLLAASPIWAKFKCGARRWPDAPVQSGRSPLRRSAGDAAKTI